jgi:MFS family permease
MTRNMPAPDLPSRSAATGPIRLPAWQETTLLAVLAGLVVSGAVWLIYHHLVPARADMGTHPAEAWSLRLHGGLAMAVLVLVGMLLASHVLPAWRRRLNRGSGGVMLGTMAMLTITGYLLYYAGSPLLRDAVSVLHWGLGLAVPALLALHMARGGRWKRNRERNSFRQ